MWKIDHGSISGVTVDSYSPVLTWQCAELREKSIHLYNKDMGNSLYFRLLARYSPEQSAGKEDILVSDSSLAAGEDASFSKGRQYQELILQVKSNSGPAGYEINYNGQGA